MKDTLYYYRHCPYCLRVLAFIGLYQLPITTEILANDDEQKPIAMVGRKQLPILQYTQEGEQHYLPESLDIIAFLAKRYNKPLLEDTQAMQWFEQFMEKARMPINTLVMPRFVRDFAYFEEFATATARDYFEKKKTESIGDFKAAIAKTAEEKATLAALLNAEATHFAAITADDFAKTATICTFAALYNVFNLVESFSVAPEVQRFMQAGYQAYRLPQF